jgi:hypothetical protein
MMLADAGERDGQEHSEGDRCGATERGHQPQRERRLAPRLCDIGGAQVERARDIGLGQRRQQAADGVQSSELTRAGGAGGDVRFDCAGFAGREGAIEVGRESARVGAVLPAEDR